MKKIPSLNTTPATTHTGEPAVTRNEAWLLIEILNPQGRDAAEHLHGSIADMSLYRFSDQPEVDYEAFSKRVEKMPFHQRQALCNSAQAFWAHTHRYGRNQETLVKRVFIIAE